MSEEQKENNMDIKTMTQERSQEQTLTLGNQFKQEDVCVSSTQAHVVFKPTLQQQRKCANCTDSAIDGTFTVVYDVNREGNTGELQVGGAGTFH